MPSHYSSDVQIFNSYFRLPHRNPQLDLFISSKTFTILQQDMSPNSYLSVKTILPIKQLPIYNLFSSLK